MSKPLLTRFEQCKDLAERLSLFEELWQMISDFPERLAPFLPFVQRGFCESLRPVRDIAYHCAISFISACPSMGEHFTNAYIVALLHEEAHISRTALSYLPQFVAVSRSSAASLIEAGSRAVTRWPTSESCANLALSVEAFKNVDVDKNVTPVK